MHAVTAVESRMAALSRRRWWDPMLALLAFAGGTVLYLVGYYQIWPGPPTVPVGWRLLVLAAVCLPMLLRSRAPALGLCLGIAPVGIDMALSPTVPVQMVFFELLFTAVARSPRRTGDYVRVGTAIATVAFIIVLPVVRGNASVIVVAALHMLLFVILPVWWGTSLRNHRNIIEAQRANAAQLERIAELDRRAAVAGERARMARDLHDVIAGHLSAIAIQSEALLSAVDGDPEMVRKVLRSVRENSVQSLTEMRAMIKVLRAGGTEEEAESMVAPARLRELDRLVESARASGLTVEVSAPETDWSGLPVEVDFAAYRILQEALTNAAKHASASRVDVAVRREDGQLVVDVVNELCPGTSDNENGDGTGLVSMHERATAAGGLFSAGPRDGYWRVHAVLPTKGSET